MTVPSREDIIEGIRKRLERVRYTGLRVCPEHEDEIVVGPHDPQDRWNDLNIVVMRGEAADKYTMEAFAHALDDIRTLLKFLEP